MDFLTNMAENNYHLDHANHNNKALKHLDAKPDFLDWVVTMCFYSALHAVQHKAFPFEVKTTTSTFSLPNFDRYCSYFSNMPGGRHEKLCDVVKTTCKEISAEYDQLKDMCWTARYKNYVVDRDHSNRAKHLKDKILAFCIDEG